MTQMKRWSKKELNYLIENASKKSVKEMSLYLERTERSTRGMINRLGISLIKEKGIPHVEWLKDEDLFLKENFYKQTVEQIAKKLGRTVYAVRSRKNKLKLNNKYQKIQESGEKIYLRNINGYELHFDKQKNKLTAHHRRIFEKNYNIELKKENVIHHIDGNKKNNLIENLLLCENTSDHRKIHAQLEKIAYQLIQEGFILFDQEKKEYIANSNRRLIEN